MLVVLFVRYICDIKRDIFLSVFIFTILFKGISFVKQFSSLIYFAREARVDRRSRACEAKLQTRKSCSLKSCSLKPSLCGSHPSQFSQGSVALQNMGVGWGQYEAAILLNSYNTLAIFEKMGWWWAL